MTVGTKNEIMNLLEMKLLYVSTEEIKNKLQFSTVDVCTTRNKEEKIPNMA